MEELIKLIRDVPDFPKKGILFKDITTLLKVPGAFQKAIDLMAEPYAGKSIDLLVSVEARGFAIGSALAYKLGTGMVLIRKPGKLPSETIQVTYDLEYGTDSIEVHKDAIQKGQKVLIVDDLLATGGTVEGVVKLVNQMGGEIVGCAFLIELDFLNGREKLPGQEIFSLIHF